MFIKFKNLLVRQSEWTVRGAGVWMCFGFVCVNTLVLVENIQLLESIDLNSIPGPLVKDEQVHSLGQVTDPCDVLFSETMDRSTLHTPCLLVSWRLGLGSP